MPCDIVLNFPSPVYTEIQTSIEDGTDNICDNYALFISGPQSNPILNTAFSISGANTSAIGGGSPSIVWDQVNPPIYKLTFLVPGVYDFAYSVSEFNEAGPVCSNSVQGTFEVLALPEVTVADCMEDFIKFKTLRCKGEVFVESKSKLYFEDLEGMSIKKISDITTDKYKSIADFVNTRVSLAIKQVTEEVMVKMPDNRFRMAVKAHRYGKYSSTYLPVSATERGIILAKHYTPLSYFLVEFVTLKSNTTKTGHTIKIFEGSTTNPVNLKNYSIDLVAGEKTRIEVNYKSFSDKVFVVSDNSDILVNDSNLSSCYNEDDCCGSHSAWGHNYVSTTGWDGTSKTNHTFGIRVEYSIRCDKDLLMCKLSQELRMAIFYRSGVELLNEWLAGDRLTFISIFGAEWAEKTIPKWEAKSDYYIDIAMDGLTEYLTDLDYLCLPCQGSRLVKIMP